MKLSNLNKFKKDLNSINIILGKNQYTLSKLAKKNMSARRSLYVYKNIKKGEKFTSENIKSVRPSFGLHPKFLLKVIGTKSNRSLKTGSRLTMSSIKNNFS